MEALVQQLLAKPKLALLETKAHVNAVTESMVGTGRSWADADGLYAGLRDEEGRASAAGLRRAPAPQGLTARVLASAQLTRLSDPSRRTTRRASSVARFGHVIHSRDVLLRWVGRRGRLGLGHGGKLDQDRRMAGDHQFLALPEEGEVAVLDRPEL